MNGTPDVYGAEFRRGLEFAAGQVQALRDLWKREGRETSASAAQDCLVAVERLIVAGPSYRDGLETAAKVVLGARETWSDEGDGDRAAAADQILAELESYIKEQYPPIPDEETN